MPKKRSSISPVILTSPSVKIKLKVLVLVVFFSLATSAIVNILDSIHYNNIITKIYSSDVNNQLQLDKTIKDYKFVLTQDNNSLNCYQLQTSYDQNLCNKHNASLPVIN